MAEKKKSQLDATKTGFPLNLIEVWERKALREGGKAFEMFKAYYDPKYKNLSADKVWENAIKRKEVIAKKKKK